MTRAKGERTEARRTGYVMRREHAVSVLQFYPVPVEVRSNTRKTEN
jgi:hypothetical protein